jgi:lysophospholipase L1-like esterase
VSGHSIRKASLRFALLSALVSAPALACGSGCGSASVDGDVADGAIIDETGPATDSGVSSDIGVADAGGDIGSPMDTGSATDTGSTAPDVTTADVGSGPKSDIHYVGRFDTSDSKGPKFEWPASAIQTRFSGTGIDVKLSGSENQFQVVIDGAPTIVLKTTSGSSTYTLAKGLSDGDHDVILYRRTEAFFGAVQFLGFVPSSGKPLIATPSATSRRIEIIGDSISCGYGDEGTSPTCSFSADTENEYLSYGALTARALGAEQVTTAWSGKGVYRDFGGSTTDELPVLYERTLPEVAGSTWDFARWVPDVVVIDLGTNDFAKGDPGSAFTTAYVAFVKQIRGHYPKAEIFVTLGPMLDGANLTQARTYLNSVVSTVKSGGDAHVSFLEFAEQNITADGGGCDYHPSLKTHQKMASTLTAAIETKMGW